MTGPADLLERAGELGRLQALVGAATDGAGGVVVVQGEAGIGKSRLLAATAAAARIAGASVLAARGAELERQFAYGVVRQLYERHVRDLPEAMRQEALAGAAEPAAGLLGLPGREYKAGADSAFLVQHAFYWLTVGLSASGPLLICVDDAQWADAPSWAWLLHLARRLEGLPVSIVVGWRTGEPDSPETELAALLTEPGVDALGPSALSMAACQEVVAAALGPGADPTFGRACHRATAGNPFYLGELVRSLVAEGVRPADDAAPAIAALSPVTVARSVLTRLARLPTGAEAIAQAVAVLENDADAHLVARLARLSTDAAGTAIESLQEARILEAGESLCFAHPILRTAVYDELSHAAHAALHRRASDLLEADGRADSAAVHLLNTTPQSDALVVERLRAAARRAVGHGAPDGAAALLGRALVEPPPAAELPGVVLELGLAEELSGEPGAAARLQEALALAPDDAAREAAARGLTQVLVYGGRVDEAIELLESVIAGLPQADQERRLRLELELISLGAGSVAHGARLTRRLGELAREARGDTPAERAVLAVYAFNRSHARDLPPGEVAGLVRRAWGEGRLLDDAGLETGTVHWCAVALIVVDELEAASEVVERTVEAAYRRGGLVGRQMAEAHRGRVRWLRGDLAGAEVDLRGALHAATLIGAVMERMYVLWLLGTVLVLRGELEEAEELLDAHGVMHEDPPMSVQTFTVLHARAKLHLARGRSDRARRDETLVRDSFRQRGIELSAAWSRVLTIACIKDGDAEAARTVAQEGLETARRSGVLSEEGIALAACGMAQGGADGLALLEQAARLMERSPRPLDRAEVLLDLGAALRRGNRRADAREPLRQALDLARASGARLIADAAEDELRATGARPRRLVLSGVDSLTPSERRTAELAAAGQTNREIAQSLFVTPKTVETHLRAAFRKLDVGARAELAAKLGAGGGPAADVTLATVLAIPRPDTATVPRDLIAEQVALHGGREVGTLEDCGLVAFDAASRALRCACAIRDRLTETGVLLRAGVHAGECTFPGAGIAGTAATVAAQIATAAAPGEVLASATVRDLTGTAGWTFGPPSAVRLPTGLGEWVVHSVAVP